MMSISKTYQNGLPVPDAVASAHSEKMLAYIQREIDVAGGQISFARYMELVLYAPGLGYYSAGAQKFGAAGDFVTAPEISSLFPRCIARQCLPVLKALKKADILELGAGTGIMAADVLLELEILNQLPQHYFILEVSPDLKERQRQALEQRCPHLLSWVEWLDTLPQDFSGVIVANEVIDAMPVHRFRTSAAGIQELYVCWRDDHLVWHADVPSSPDLIESIKKLQSAGLLGVGDYESEFNLWVPAWIQSLSQSLQKGLILLLDYGFPRHEFYHPDRSMGTLMCHYRHHAHTDPFLLPGLQDITAHVDFTQVAESAINAHLDVAGYTTQAAFLLGCGLDEMMADVSDVQEQFMLAQQVKMLTLPSEMGELFKVMALTRDIDMPLCGFALQDRRGRL